MATPARKMTSAQWFARAHQFHVAGILLRAHETVTRQIIVFPEVTCKAFTAEAYLKCLLTLRRKWFPNDHDLHLLFGLLSPADQSQIEQWWDADSLPGLLAFHKTTPGKAAAPKTLNQSLKLCAKAFLWWRYQSEDQIYWYLRGFSGDVRQLILETRPEWDASPPDMFGNDPKP